MAKNTIKDLRDHLFATLEALQDPENPMDLERAKAVSEVAQTIINSAKVEVDLIRAVGGSQPSSKGFFTGGSEERQLAGPMPERRS